ncbi:MAG TPA: M20/M25/M40 family metallo-hydrolase [Terrimesophilobacter sp.]|jgi:amidohydrolase|uniref:M20/M25/M40 family metallo-hydrolase n=1 Tax=Terrimesophilobacter sp. TaxID=2906435 RepID=UPI002F94EB6A
MTQLNRESVRESIVTTLDDRHLWLRELSHAVWACNDLGWEERPAVAAILAHARELGGPIDIEEGIGGFETAFRITLDTGRPGPHVATMAEYDAVAGLGQACGHNLISTATIGALTGLLPSIDSLNGKFTVFGTPAEETAGGKMYMEDAGLFEGLDALLMFHPKDISTVGQRSLTMLPLVIEFSGHSVHAAAFPHRGRNALDAFVNMYVSISTMRQQLHMDARIHGIVTDGGVTPANIPDFVRAEYVCRAIERSYAEELIERVKTCARAAAEAAQCEVAFPEPERLAYESVIPDTELCDVMREAAAFVNVQLVEDEPVLWASNDSGRISQRVPTAPLSLSIGTPPLGEHSHEFREAAGSPDGDRAFSDASKILALTAADLMLSR